MVCDADSAVNSAAFNQLMTSKGLNRFNDFGRSIDAPLSRPAQRPSLGSNAAGGAVKPVNLWVNPSSLFTSQRPQASYQDLDTIFDNYYYTLLYNNCVSTLLDISRLPF